MPDLFVIPDLVELGLSVSGDIVRASALIGDFVRISAIVCGFLLCAFWIALLVGVWLWLRGREEE